MEVNKYKEHYFSSENYKSSSFMTQLMVSLWVISYKFVECVNCNNGYIVVSRVNPYNPLSYLAMLIVFLIAMTVHTFGGLFSNSVEAISEISNQFKYK